VRFSPGTGLFAVPTNFNAAQIGAEQLGVPATCAGGTLDGLACNTSDNCDPSGTPGACRRIDTGDTRISSSPVLRNGRLWATHSSGLPATGTADRTAVFWYQLDPTSAAAPVVQSGMLDGGPGVHHFYPSIAANVRDDALVGFTRSDTTRFAESVGTIRLGTDAPGAMGVVAVAKPGEAGYFKTYADDENRWGDYSATVVDPVDDLTLWSIEEYAAGSVANDTWGTWWSAHSVPLCGTTPLPNCVAATRASLAIKEAPSGRERLKLRLRRFTSVVTQASFGNPVTGTSRYDVCVYDAANALVGEIRVVRARETCGTSAVPCWPVSSTGYKYKDTLAASDGVQRIDVKGGDALRGHVTVTAANDAAKGQSALPLGMAAQLAGNAAASVQLVTSDGSCFATTLPRVKTADGTAFSAVKP